MEKPASEVSEQKGSPSFAAPVLKKRFALLGACTMLCESVDNFWGRKINPSFLDRSERAFAILLYFFLATRMTHAYLINGQVVQLLYLLDQLIVLFFFAFRRATAKFTKRLQDLLIGYVGCILPLMMGPITPKNAIVPSIVAIIIMFLGGAIYLGSKLTLRRSFGIIAANRGIKTSGLYMIVRHPMYLGYTLSLTGFLLSGPNMTNLCIVFFTCLLFFWRINAEERLLIEDTNYRIYMERTRYRLLPGVY